MAEDTFYQEGAGTQNPDFGTQDEPTPMETDWQTALRPVTIRQMHDAKLPHSKADFILDGKEVKNLTVVAQIIEDTVQDDGEIRRITYTLEDGTSKGRIKAFYTAPREHPPPLFPLKYGRFGGTLLRLGDRNYLRIVHLRAVVDPHEIFYHPLEVVTADLIYRRGKQPRSSVAGPSDSESILLVVGGSQDVVVPPALSVPAVPAPAVPAPAAQDPAAPFTAVQDPVIPPQEPSLPSGSYILIPRRVRLATQQPTPEESDSSSSEAESAEDPPDSDAESGTADSFKTAQSDDDYEQDMDDTPLPEAPLAGIPRERDPYSHLTSLQREILLYLHNLDADAEEREVGTPISNFVWSFRQRDIDLSGLGEAFDALCQEGLIDEPQENCLRLIDIPGRKKPKFFS